MADLGSFLGAAGVGSAIGQAVVQLELSTEKYQAELAAAEAKTKASTGAISQSTTSMSSGLSKFGLTATNVAVGAGIAFGAFAVSSVKAFMDSQRVMAQTEAVLKSTGGQAGVTADDIDKLTSSLRDQTGVDDDVIQSSTNLLLTFRDVKNEVGAGNDVFNQAQGAILDMATALNQGAIPSADQLKTSTIQLGKALNDPITGLTALRRVGVSFTESQVETIKRLQESGDLMGAQKIILGELSKEFGGAAEAAGDTFAGQLAKLKSHLQDVQEEVGEALMPALESLMSVVEALVPVFGFLAKAIQYLPLVQMAEDIQDIKTRTDEGGLGWRDYADAIFDTVPILGSFIDLADHTTETLGDQRGVIGSLSDFYRSKYAEAVGSAATATKKFADMSVKEINEWKGETKESFETYVINLEKVQEETDFTRKDLRDSFKAMLENARDLNTAMRTLSREHWINDDFVKFLAEQPDKLILFADSNEKQQRRMQDQWEKSGEILKTKVNDHLDDIVTVLDNLDKGDTKHKVTIEYEYKGFDPSKPGMAHQTP